GVVARAAVERQLDDVRRERGGTDRVVAAQGFDGQRVVGHLGAADAHEGRQPDHRVAGPAAEHRDGVVAVGAADGDRVRRAVAGRAADGRGQVDVHLRHVGAGQVVDGGGVRPAQGVDGDDLDVVEVHDDVADVAGEAHALADGRGLEGLAEGAAVE